MMTSLLKQATKSELEVAWAMIQDAIAQRKAEGSAQWQNGYPNKKTIEDDITSRNGYLLVEDGVPVAYAAIIFDREPAYDNIEGQWLTEGDYAVVHRVARSGNTRVRGLARKIFAFAERLCAEKGISSIRLDTNFDNAPMLSLMDDLGYHYCGEIFFQGASRRAYEKVLST